VREQLRLAQLSFLEILTELHLLKSVLPSVELRGDSIDAAEGAFPNLRLHSKARVDVGEDFGDVLVFEREAQVHGL
jgi:hypothetical protein